MDREAFLEALALRLPEVARGEKILCAVSGGADSMFLLWALQELSCKGLFSLIVAHFHHGIRGEEADEEAAFVAAYCRAQGLLFVQGQADVPDHAREKNISLELAARELRRAFLLRSMEEQGAALIALGHQANDQAETLLLNLIRGAGLRGLSAMPVWSAPLWRPLLPYTRADIETWLALLKLDYRVDSSNLGEDYRRNRVRFLLSGMEEENPRLIQNIFRTTQLLQEDERYLEQEARELYARAHAEDGMEVKGLLAAEQPLRARALRFFLQENGFVQNIEEKHMAALQRMLQSGGNSSLDLPGGRRIALEYGKLFLPEVKEEEARAFWPLKLDGETDTPWGKFLLRTIEWPQGWGNGKGRCVYCNAEALVGSCIRGRLPGDWIQPFGMDGRKSVKKAYIDWKVPKEARGGPLLAGTQEAGELLWVPGWGLSQKCACKEHKRIVQIEFIPYDDRAEELKTSRRIEHAR